MRRRLVRCGLMTALLLRRLLLRGLLSRRLVFHFGPMVSNDTSRRRADDGMMARHMSGHAADHRALHAAFGRCDSRSRSETDDG